MVIKIDGKDCGKILKDYAFANFGKIMGCEKVEEMSIKIECNYSMIEEMEITKKELSEPSKESEA